MADMEVRRRGGWGDLVLPPASRPASLQRPLHQDTGARPSAHSFPLLCRVESPHRSGAAGHRCFRVQLSPLLAARSPPLAALASSESGRRIGAVDAPPPATATDRCVIAASGLPHASSFSSFLHVLPLVDRSSSLPVSPAPPLQGLPPVAEAREKGGREDGRTRERRWGGVWRWRREWAQGWEGIGHPRAHQRARVFTGWKRK